MADNKEFYHQLQAYALGCLDKDDLAKLRTHIYSGKDYQWQELGEYQNLAALLPCILNIEIPEQQLKDKVARKLYRVRDEVRTKRGEAGNFKNFPFEDNSILEKTEPQKFRFEEDIKKPEEPEIEKEEIDKEPEEEHSEKIQEEEDIISKTEDFEVVSPAMKSSDFFRPTQDTQIKERDKKAPSEMPKPKEEEKKKIKEEPAKSSFKKADEKVSIQQDKQRAKYSDEDEISSTKIGSIAIISLIILFLLVIAAGVYAYFSISSDVKLYKSEVERLNEEIKTLSAENNNARGVQALLVQQGTRIISLTSEAGSTGSASAMVNFESRKGYFQAREIPPLQADKAYQLWITADGRSSSLALIKNTSLLVEYYPFEIPRLSNQNVRLLLTEEPAEGSQVPGGKVILSGAF